MNTYTVTADVLELLNVILPISAFAGTYRVFAPLLRENVCPPIVIVAVTPDGRFNITNSNPVPWGVKLIVTDAEDDADTDTDCGETSVYDP